MDFNFTQWLGLGAAGGVLLGIITGCWQKIKAVTWHFVGYAIAHVEIKDDQTANAVLAHLIKNYKRSKIYDRTYGAAYEYTRSDGKYGMIPYEFLGSKTLIFWNKWFPMFFSVGNKKGESTQQNNGTTQDTLWSSYLKEKPNMRSMTFIRGTYNISKIIREACNTRNTLSWNTGKDAKHRRFFIRKIPNPQGAEKINNAYSVGTQIAWYYEGHFQLLDKNPWELGRSQIGDKRALDLLVFPDRIKNLIREVQTWRNNREWYVERGLRWRRGWALYGPPGTGKSALVRAIAEDEDMPLFVFSLGELLNSDLQKSWEDMQAHVPCIALIEDIDNVFHGRVNIAGNNLGLGKLLGATATALSTNDKKDDVGPEKSCKLGMLTFDCLLNCIDGVDKGDGIFTVITTNDITKIDPALGQPTKAPDGSIQFISSRPGRIDKAIELGHMENREKILMAERILAEYPRGLKEMKNFIDNFHEHLETPAQFQERCSQLALTYFWEERSKKEGLLESSHDELRRQLLSVRKDSLKTIVNNNRLEHQVV